MLTYELLSAGYQLLEDGRVVLLCPFDPTKPGREPFADDAAKVAHIAENFPSAVPA